MGGLFGSKTPAPTPVQAMPDTEDPAVKEAQKRAAMAATQRSGRTSTVLTTPATRAPTGTTGAGTTAYGNSLLGQSN
ncbi:hypothetical protein HGP16_25480 [Rhizobium sp. P40RR-XXII]|uniref:hypothetical protein n=1 Tax=Rhizobium sp. P40RR-XXII TaxID=2726739 RepID=UPI00145795F3|nr:hypothetical protein [Rhizobium sp. P40RR-XXII]NLS19894.1 hypothetical protein [Rhizobium sp. P40RR-XXII]